MRGVVAYGQSYLTAHLAQHLAYRLRHLLYDRMQRLSFAYHDRVQTGELMSRATADVEAVRLFFQFGWPIGLSVALAGAGTMVAMAWLDWRLLGLTLLSLPFFLGVVLGIGHLLRPLQVWVQEKTGDLTVTLQESLAGIRVVKAFARERQQIEGFAQAAETLAQARMAVAAKEAISFPLLTLLLSLAVALTLYIGGRRVIAGVMSLGTLVAATSYLAQLAQPLRRLSWLTGMVSLCQAGAERLFEILDTVPGSRMPRRPALCHISTGAYSSST
jgi:ATP-binding cassette subfamily B protein